MFHGVSAPFDHDCELLIMVDRGELMVELAHSIKVNHLFQNVKQCWSVLPLNLQPLSIINHYNKPDQA